MTAAASPLPQATLQAFESVLARHDSATVALEEWCALRGIADPAHITAQTVQTPGQNPPADVRRQLGLTADKAVAMRHVRLGCGATVLSVAWNWYNPALLTAEMETALRVSPTPFGKVVAPLRFRRRVLETVPGPVVGCPADTISTHRAMLILPDGQPLSYLIECYTAANLAAALR